METVLHALFPGMHNTRLRRVYIANGESKKFRRAKGGGSLVFETLKKSRLFYYQKSGDKIYRGKIEIFVYRDN